jgi:ribosome biogenesis GTPase A
MQLLDVPGVLWPKFDDPATGFKLAVTGAISDDVFDYIEVSAVLAEHIVKINPQTLPARYGVDSHLEQGMPILQAIGKQRGFLLTGARVDEEKAAALLLREFRQGVLGPFTLEKPPVLSGSE